jgi:hypothetical protein
MPTSCRLFSGFLYPETKMKINSHNLFNDPTSAIAQIAELRERVATLHQLVGPELRKVIDSHDFSFSTMNVIFNYGERLRESVAILKETVVKLHELATGTGAVGT